MKSFIVQSITKEFRGLLLMPSGLRRWTAPAATRAEAEELLAEKVKHFG